MLLFYSVSVNFQESGLCLILHLARGKKLNKMPFSLTHSSRFLQPGVMQLCGPQAAVKFRGKTHQLYPKRLLGATSALVGAAQYH